MNLKSLIPRGLFARSLLIIVLPIAMMQMVVTYLFFDLHWEQVSRRMSESAAGDVALVSDLYLRDPTPENFDVIAKEARTRLRLSVALLEGAQLPEAARRATIPAFDRTLNRALAGSLTLPYWYDTTRYPDYVDIRVATPDGVLRFLAYRDRVFASTGGIFLLWLAGATIMLACQSCSFVTRSNRWSDLPMLPNALARAKVWA
jgi:two-component system, OmpR family, osmolarity sensor histidine kinase EnvZ